MIFGVGARASTPGRGITAISKIVEPNMYKLKKIDIITLKLYLAHFLMD